LQFSGAESFDLFLFHSSKAEPLKEIPITTNGMEIGIGSKVIELSAFESQEFQGGVFVLVIIKKTW
jgi:hypothetical protein